MKRKPLSWAADHRYAPSSPCVICGAPTQSISIKCETCLKAAFLKGEIEFAREALEKKPDREIQLGCDRRRQRHLVLFRTPALAWCGAEVTEIFKRRKYVKRGEFLPDVCAPCLAKYRELGV